MVHILDEGIVASGGTLQRVAAGGMLHKLALQQPGNTVLAETIQTGDVAGNTREHENCFTGESKIGVVYLRKEHSSDIEHLPCIGASNTGDIFVVRLDQAQGSGKVFLTTGRVFGAFEVKFRKRWFSFVIFLKRFKANKPEPHDLPALPHLPHKEPHNFHSGP